jgi:hypothetical protein
VQNYIESIRDKTLIERGTQELSTTYYGHKPMHQPNKIKKEEGLFEASGGLSKEAILLKTQLQ